MTAAARSITGSDRVSAPRSSKTLHQNKRSGCWQSAANGGSGILRESLSTIGDDDLGKRREHIQHLTENFR
jgi:hypothetical protein